VSKSNNASLRQRGSNCEDIFSLDYGKAVDPKKNLFHDDVDDLASTAKARRTNPSLNMLLETAPTSRGFRGLGKIVEAQNEDIDLSIQRPDILSNFASAFIEGR
jgi:hypothetical protein